MLTEPDDMLATGIDIEARPPGKKVKRLSLLSGGERSLTAIAFLMAIFMASPSPFYVLDEVEAALDDTNLQRLLAILAELRDSSQLIIVTHQKRTMEVADTLYGTACRAMGCPPWSASGCGSASGPDRPAAADPLSPGRDRGSARLVAPWSKI